MKISRNFLVTFAALMVLLGATLGIIKYMQSDIFIYIALLWTAGCFVTAIFVKSNWRLGVIYASAAFLAFGLYETYLAGWFQKPQAQQHIRMAGSITAGGYSQFHPLLGYAPLPNVQVTAQKYCDNELIYDVRYTIKDGLRITPTPNDASLPAVLFFGDSFTLGEGVKDQEAMPYRFAEKAKRQFAAFNFGFHGYGPQQMLAMLQNKMEQKVLAGHQPQYAVYQALPYHVERCVGLARWDITGPHYVLDAQGKLSYSGPFHGPVVTHLLSILRQSNVMGRLIWSSRGRRSADIDLFVEIVKESETVFKQRYGGKFYMLLWRYSESEASSFIECMNKLKARQIDVRRTEEIFPDYDSTRSKYLIPHDGHPNALTHEIMADYLFKLMQADVSAAAID